MPIALSALLVKLAPVITKHAAKLALDHLPGAALSDLIKDQAPEVVQKLAEKISTQRPVEKAIIATCEKNSLPNESIQALRSWVKDDSSQGLLSGLQNGELPTHDTAEEVAETLIPYLTTLDSARTKEIAREILTSFLEKLDEFAVFEDAGLARHDLREEARYANLNERLNDLKILLANQRQPAIPPESTEALPEHEIKYVARLDEARRLLEAGQIKAAKTILKSLRADLDVQTSSQLILYRVEANLGICSLFLDNCIDAAAEYFDTARRHQPEHPTGLANCARICLLRNNAAEALTLSKEALLRDPKHSYARALYAQALYALDKKDDLRKLSEEVEIQSDSIVLLALAQNSIQSEDYESAERLAQRVTELKPTDPYGWELLGRAIAVPIQKKLNAGQPVPWMIPAQETELLKRAHTAFTRSIQILRDTDWKDAMVTALANRASVGALSGDFEQSLADCEDALRLDSSLELAHVTKAAVLLQLNRHSDAAAAYEQVVTAFTPEPRHRLALAVCYLNCGQQSKAVTLLEKLVGSYDSVATRVRVNEVLLEAYIVTGRKDLAQGVLDQSSGQVSELEYAELSSRFYEVTGDFARAISGLEAMREAATGTRRQRITLELADILYKAGLFEEAAREFASITNEQVNNSFRTKILRFIVQRESL